MIVNSTLMFIMDYSEGECEIININDFLDPYGKCNKELEMTFNGINYSPRQEIIADILKKS